jgi:hypothetical protein
LNEVRDGFSKAQPPPVQAANIASERRNVIFGPFFRSHRRFSVPRRVMV